MLANDAFTDKVIIVAEHHEECCRLIDLTLKGQDYSDIRHANTSENIYAILKSFYDHPERIGLIVINENLPHTDLLAMQQSLCSKTDVAAIPFVIIGDAVSDSSSSSINQSLALTDQWLTYRIATPIDPKELRLAITFLLKLRHERLNQNGQKEQLINQLAANSQNDAKLKYLVAHDELTGLFNRSNFERQLKLALNRCHKLQKSAALLFIEVNRFCLINELNGFDEGDRLLVELSLLMRQWVSSKSLFARMGVNEFCLFLDDMNVLQAKKYAEKIKTSVESYKFLLTEASHNVSLSMGIVTLDENLSINNPAKMILHARQACHLAKLDGPEKIGVYNAEDRAIKERQNDMHWLPIIQKALRENQLFLLFQPVVQLDNGSISHYEVVVRMRASGKIILPSIFIPVAERMALIHGIDLWVIERTIDFLAVLPSAKSYVSVSIKLSASAVHYADLIAFIRDKLELTWIDASRLTFEITESAVIEHFDRTLQLVNNIRSLGCKFTLNNFGAGVHAFNYLKHFPVDYIKIDGQFIKQSTSDETDQTLLKSMVDMVTKAGKKTIFVYVESPSTVLKLKEFGITLAQGYTFGKPEANLLEGPAIPFAQYMSERKRIEKALREKESYLRVLIDNMPFLVWLKDTQSRFLAVNQKLAQQLGLPNSEAIIGKTDFDYYPPEKARQYQQEDQNVLASRQSISFDEDTIDDLGIRQWTETFLTSVVEHGGELLGTLGFARDISKRKTIEADLRIAATAFESQEGIIVTDADTVILKVNHAFTRMTGYTPEEAIGLKMNLVKSGIQDGEFYAEMWESIHRTGSWQGEIWNRRKNGDVYPEWLTISAVQAENGAITHFVGTMIDITARKALEEQMHHLAHYDVLTDLPNRILLGDRLQQSIAQARRENTRLAIMYIDLDKFKPVNDNLGHDIGDLLLKEVALRLLTCMKRESDTVSRLGGDEFVVLLSSFDQVDDVAKLAEKILDTLNQSFTIEDNQIQISSSIGIALYPTHGTDAVSLMKNADIAMYQAKRAGRSCFKFCVAEESNQDELT